MDHTPSASPPADHLAARRSDVDAKQDRLALLLEGLGCEAALLMNPAHVAWFTAGLTARGLAAETERPAVFTDGRQRWIVCSSVDSQRLFDEELDRLGFQLKEWAWDAGRAELLANIVSGRKVAVDRPYPNIPLLVEQLRPLVRSLSAYEREAVTRLGRVLAHALEATARSLRPGDTEAEAAAQIGHRLMHRGAEPVAVAAAADGRGRKYRRTGYTAAPIRSSCTLQATAQKDGLYLAASRTLAFGPPSDVFRAEHDRAVRISAVYLALSRPGETMGAAVHSATRLLAGSENEYEGRLCPPVHGAGRLPAEELRRGGRDEPFAEGQTLVWQARIGAAAVVDSVLVTRAGPLPLTPPELWPFKRIRVGDIAFDVPDILVRND